MNKNENLPNRQIVTTDVIALTCCLLLGLSLRFEFLNSFWANPDEGIYFQVAVKDNLLSAIKSTFAHAHPPLYYLIIWVTAIFSQSLYILRTPSLIFGLAAIISIYFLTKELVGRRGALAAAIITALSPAAIIYSQVIRPYTLVLTLLPLSIIGLVRYLKTKRIDELRLYSVTFSLAIFTHYCSIIVFLSLCLIIFSFILLRKLPLSELGRIVKAHYFIFLSILLVSLVSLRFIISSKLIRKLQMPGSWLEPYFITNGDSLINNLLGTIGFLFGAEHLFIAALLICIGLFVAIYRKNYILLGFTISPLIIAILFSYLRLYPLGGSRHSVYLLPFLLLPVGLLAEICFRNVRTSIYSLTGIILLIFVNKGVVSENRFFSGKHYSYYLLAPEFTVPRSDFEDISARLNELTKKKGYLIMDQQTFQAFIPLFYEEYIKSHDESHHFHWNEIEILLLDTYQLKIKGKSIEIELTKHLSEIKSRFPALKEEILRSELYLLLSTWEHKIDASAFPKSWAQTVNHNDTLGIFKVSYADLTGQT